MTARALSIALVAALACAAGCSAGEESSDGSGDDAPRVPPDIDGRLTINEIMASNAATMYDELGGTGDWVELYNPTDVEVPIGGYSITDDLSEPSRARIDASVVVPPRGHVVLWLDGDPARGPAHVSVTLARDGGEVGLARPDGTYIDRVVYGAQLVDLSAAREPDGSDRWRIEWHVSPGEPNPDGDGRPAEPESDDVPPEQVPAAGDQTDRVLGYDAMPDFELLVAPDAVASLEASPFEYVEAMLVYDGRSYGPIGLRLKGQNSFRPFGQKPSFRINIDEFVPGAKLLGLDDLTLNNMVDDMSMMHERLSYMIARQVGPASRANHALVSVNGQFYGLYANVETVKWHMLTRWFSDPFGPLFEATDVDFVPEDISDFELESGPDDRSLLEGLAAALALPSADDAIAAAGGYVDIPQFWRFWAMCAVVGQFDSFPYSNPGDDYFAYADPGTGRLWFLPWGMDETFYAGDHDVLAVSSLLARRCVESPACFQGFVAEVWSLLELTEAIDLAAEIDLVAAQIAPHVALDARKPYSDATVLEFQQQLRWFVSGRRTKLSSMLPP